MQGAAQRGRDRDEEARAAAAEPAGGAGPAQAVPDDGRLGALCDAVCATSCPPEEQLALLRAGLGCPEEVAAVVLELLLQAGAGGAGRESLLSILGRAVSHCGGVGDESAATEGAGRGKRHKGAGRGFV